jgi:hypothetical protein
LCSLTEEALPAYALGQFNGTVVKAIFERFYYGCGEELVDEIAACKAPADVIM